MATEKVLPFDPATIGLYGQTHCGKTTQAVYLAEWLFEQTGLKTAYELTDDGDIAQAEDAIVRGIITKIDLRQVPNPYLMADKISAGLVPVVSGWNEKEDRATGEFKSFDWKPYGLLVVDSGSGLSDMMFQDLSQKAGMGVNIGGEGATTFVDGSAGWGTVTIGGSNKSHYNVVQTRMHRTISRYAQLMQREKLIILMTFSEDSGEVETSKLKVTGPKIAGSAATPQIPGWLKFTYHLTKTGTSVSKELAPTLWTTEHTVPGEGNAKCLANRRFPILTPQDTKLTEHLPTKYDPADIVKALKDHKEATRIISEEKRKRSNKGLTPAVKV